MISRKITDNTLEKELKRVILTRDEITIDRFHELVENSTVLDVKGKVKLDEFFDLLAEKVSHEIGFDKNGLIDLFKQREKDGSTAITPFVATPHIIIPGSNRFKLVVARCKEGIEFTSENDKVKAIFVLFGAKDERTFHLRALSAIAHIVQNPYFEKTWLNAKDEHQLRDIILLSERKRFKMR